MFALSCLKVEIPNFRRRRRNFMAAPILVVDILTRGMLGFDFVTSEGPQTIGEGGALFRIQSISKHVKAFHILAGHFLCRIWNRGTGVHRRSCSLVPTVMRRLTGGFHRAIFQSRSEALILFARFCR